MKFIIIISLFFAGLSASAQKEEDVLLGTMKKFHEAMVKGTGVEPYLDNDLSYGHSNGWIENKKDFISDLGGKIIYHSMKEDSVAVVVSGNMAHARFVSDVDVSLNNNRITLHLRVLEVWVKNKNNWQLFARQAIR